MNQYALPGFMTPDAPKADKRIIANTDGSFSIPLPTDLGNPYTISKLVLQIFHNFGGHDPILVLDDEQYTIFKNGDAAPLSYAIVVPTTTVALSPSSYYVRLVVDNKEVSSWDLTVPADPNNLAVQLIRQGKCRNPITVDAGNCQPNVDGDLNPGDVPTSISLFDTSNSQVYKLSIVLVNGTPSITIIPD